MKLIKRIAYPLIILIIGASCSSTKYASAQNDGYYDDYSNNYQDENYNDDNSYNNDDYDSPNNYEDAPAEVNINVFNDALTPHGNWVVSASYGRVWVPRQHNFVPYSTGGRWVHSSYGWTWASNYSWGWAPFHYGRWGYDPFYGWTWIPGYEWGPAWVSWRTGGGYYGWTPMGPGVSIGINVGYGVPYNRWVFAPCRYMGYNNINRYYVRPSRNTTIIKNTTIINNTTVYNNRKFVAGPNRAEVERVSGRKVNTVKVVNSSKPGNTVVKNNAIQMYRPGVKQKVQQDLQNKKDNVNVNQQRQDQVNKGKDYIQNKKNNNEKNNIQNDNLQQNNAQANNSKQNNNSKPDDRDRINNNQQQQNNSKSDKRDRTKNTRQQTNQQNNNANNSKPDKRERRNNNQQQNSRQYQNDQSLQKIENNTQRMNTERRRQLNDQWSNKRQDFNRQPQRQQQPVYRQQGNENTRSRRN